MRTLWMGGWLDNRPVASCAACLFDISVLGSDDDCGFKFLVFQIQTQRAKPPVGRI